MSVQLRHLLNDETGATAIEYGLIAVLISTVAIAAFTAIGTNVGTSMNNVAGKL
ncbi:MAG: Flp family type IVb pilin [Alphaproteobacteria bacterium]|nr:Flp family type IVb pilin [Alphaproteobacteria bacterium]